MTVKVGIFGGAFDPPHVGHNSCIEFALGSKVRCDRIFVIPSGDRPDKPNQSPYSQRLELAQIAFQPYGKVFVGQWESPEHRQGSTFTYDTVMLLKKLYPTWDFHLIIGKDNEKSLASWHRGEELLKELAGTIVVPRTVVNSTAIRKSPRDYSDQLNPLVLRIIQQKRMYK